MVDGPNEPSSIHQPSTINHQPEHTVAGLRRIRTGLPPIIVPRYDSAAP
jgi:hypothetical protein